MPGPTFDHRFVFVVTVYDTRTGTRRVTVPDLLGTLIGTERDTVRWIVLTRTIAMRLLLLD